MKRIAHASAALLLLFYGSVRFTDAARSTGAAVPPVAQEDPVRALLAQEVDTWDLVITDYRDGKSLGSRSGTEVCTLPSTGEWLISDITMERAGGPPVWIHMALGYTPATRRFVGFLVDSFGGRPATLDGEAGEEPTVRVVSEGFDHEGYARWTTRWLSDDERLTTLEEEGDEGWVRFREIVHRRRSAK